MNHKFCLLVVLSFLLNSTANATSVTLKGHLSESADVRIFGSDSTKIGAVFSADPIDSINNVMLYAFQVSSPDQVRFQTFSVAAGGIEPYFSLFSGSGNSAVFVDSNYDQAFSSGGDIDKTINLGAGNYTAAISTFANMSFAENLGTGTLGDGFISLGTSYGSIEPLFYSLSITSNSLTNVPIPGTLGLMALGISMLIGFKKQNV